VAPARAFAIEPRVPLLDEPFSALDELTARRLRILLQEPWRQGSPTGLLATHNLLEAAFLIDSVPWSNHEGIITAAKRFHAAMANRAADRTAAASGAKPPFERK
jgi:ABC-type nitrate/sulfonate/bicarbonate transport system ATPase subunit